MKSGWIRFFFAWLTLTVVTGCNNLPLAKAPALQFCSNLDWFEIGRVDGSVGAKPSRENEHRARCAAGPHPFEEEAYVNGRNAGLVEYCTPTTAFEAGRTAATYEHVCPDYLEKTFLENYRVGSKVRALESENLDLQSRIDNLLRLLKPSQAGGSVRAQIDHLKGLRAKNESEIGTLESRAQNEVSRF